MIIILTIFFIFAVIKLIFGKQLKQKHSHWSTLIHNFNFSTKEFYKLLEEELVSHGIKGIRIDEASFKEKGLLSHSRWYLIVSWKDYQYELCGAQFGKGFFVSWHLFFCFSLAQRFIGGIPFLGKWLINIFYPITHYTQDTASMFMTYTHQSVLTVIDKITSEKGSRKLLETERKPIQNNVFKR